MNHIYKVVWNKARQCYMVVSEYAKSQTKSCSTAKLFAAKAAMAAVAAISIGMSASVADAAADPNVRLATATDYVAASVASKPDDTYQSEKVPVDGINYWVKEGWTIESAVKKRFPSAANSNLVVLYKNSSDAENATFACVDTTVLGTSVNTVLNKNILTVEDNGYVGAVNTATTGATYNCNYWIEKNGVWTNVGGSEKNISANAYQATLDNGVWKANGKVVDYHDIYAIGDKAWVFKNPDGSLYKGSVFGLNNELLKTMTDANGKLVSVWGTDRIDADGEQANLTVGQVNRITDTFTKNDKALAEADIKQVNSADRGANDAANVVKKYTLIRNDENGTAVTGTIVDTDTQYTFNRTGGTGGQDVTVTVTDNAGSNPQEMVTGSIVTADSTEKVTKITINGVDYNVVDTITTATKSEDGKTLTISKTGAEDVVFIDTDTTYTAGQNVQINGTEISATDTITTATKSEDGKTLTISKTGAADVVFTDTDTTYTAGQNVQINGTEISATDTITTATKSEDGKTLTISKTGAEDVVFTDTDTITTATKSEDGKTLTISKTGAEDVVFIDTDTTYTAGQNVQINGTEISATDTITTATKSEDGKTLTISKTGAEDVVFIDTDTTYTAGQNVQINGTVISATDTKYSMTQMTQGTGIVLNTVDAQGAPTAQNSIGFSSTNKYLTIENGQNGIEWTVNIDDIKADVTQDTNTKYQVGAVAAADGANGATINLSKKDLGDSAYTVDSSVGMTGDDNITVGVTNGVINVALNDDITVNNITVNEQVTIGEGDTITTITGGTINTTTIEATTINGDTINGDTINTTEINVGTTQITENNITMGDTVITNESITVGDTVIEGDNITTNTVNTTTVNTTEINLGDTNITEADYLEVVEESKKHTTVVLAQGEENLQISQDTNENGGIEYTLSLNGDITVDNITVNESITMGDTIINEEGITTNNIDATTINTETINLGDTQITENNITMGDTVITNENITVGDTVIEGDNITTNTVNTTTVNTTEINLGDTNITEEDYLEVVEESKKHTTVKLGEGEENLELSAGTNANGGLEYTLSLKGDITVDNITVNEQITVGDTIINGDSITTTTINGDTINAETINLGDTVITENNITMGDTVITENKIEMGDTKITNESITVGDTVITGDNITINGDSVVTDVTVGDVVKVDEYTNKQTITVTEADGTKVEKDIIDRDTTYTADEKFITITEGNEIQLITHVDDVAAGWDTEDKHNIIIQLKGTSNGVAASSIGTEQVIEGIALSEEVGDVTNEEYVSNFGAGTTLVEAVNTTYTEAKKHTTVVLGEGEENLKLEEGENADGGIEYTVSLNKDIKADSITINDSKVVINKEGINAGDNKITNVADGEVSATSKDAVNGSQLYGLAQNVNKLGGRVSKGLAGASALAALHPLEFDPDDKLSFAAGVGHYDGKTAAAIGAFYRPDEKVMISLGGTMGDGKEMVNAGVSFSLDRTPNKTNTKTAMAKEIVELRERLAQMEQFMMQQQGFKPLSGEMKLFPDVPENHWAYEYVAKLYADGIIEGYPDGNYSGDRMMTRYEMAAIIYRAMQRGANVDGKMIKEFEPELCRVRVDRISGADNDYNKIERVRLNTGVGKDKYANKIQVAEAAK